MPSEFDQKKIEAMRKAANLDQPLQEFTPPTDKRDYFRWLFFSLEGKLSQSAFQVGLAKLFGAVLIVPLIWLLTHISPIFGILAIAVIPIIWAAFALGIKRSQDVGLSQVLFLVIFFLGLGLFFMIALLFFEKDQFKRG